MSKQIPIPTVDDEEREKNGESGIAATLRAVVEQREAKLLESVAAQINALREPAEEREVVTPKRAAGSIRLASPMEPLYRRLPEQEREIRTPDSDHYMAEWIRGHAYGDRARMFEAHAQLEAIFGRATTTEGIAGASGAFSSGTGGTLIPRPLEQVVMINRDRVAKMRKFATNYTMTAQQHTIPTMAQMTGHMTAEGVATTQGEPTISSVSLIARKGQVMARATEEMLADAAINLVSAYAQRAGKALGTLEDNQFFKDGSGTAPNISAFLAGTAYTNTTAGTMSYTDMVGMYFAVPQAYRDNAKWLIADNVLVLLSALKDGNGRPFYASLAEAPRPIVDDPTAVGTILGKPVYSVPFTNGTIWFGDPQAAYAVGSRQGIESRVDASVGFSAGEIYFKISQRFDGNNLDQGAGYQEPVITAVNTL